MNLCINARDAMPNGGLLTLEVDKTTVDPDETHPLADLDPGDYVTIAVTDTGEGMSPEVVSQAFEPFFTTKEASKGTGLGLSMVYGFVKQSRGHVKIYSEPGHGSTIRIYLPAVEDETAGQAATSTGAIDVEGGSGHILVVEDNAEVRERVMRQLHQLGYETTTANSGPEALALLQKGGRFDLLFTNVVMPGGMNGLQLADEAVRLQPDLPVLFTSGYTETAVLRDGTVPAGTSLLNKPYRRADLALKLRQMLC
ncbi:MAG: ATP-binding protein [Gammaproteobacteria bacterium]|nr:ATP-binding protein [Gammaproteobacteria bacterium]